MSYMYIIKCDHVLQPRGSFLPMLRSSLNINATTAASTVSLFGTWELNNLLLKFLQCTQRRGHEINDSGGLSCTPGSEVRSGILV